MRLSALIAIVLALLALPAAAAPADAAPADAEAVEQAKKLHAMGVTNFDLGRLDQTLSD